MTEENNEMMNLLKELVGRIKEIEKTVYNNDNGEFCPPSR